MRYGLNESNLWLKAIFQFVLILRNLLHFLLSKIAYHLPHAACFSVDVVSRQRWLCSPKSQKQALIPGVMESYLCPWMIRCCKGHPHSGQLHSGWRHSMVAGLSYSPNALMEVVNRTQRTVLFDLQTSLFFEKVKQTCLHTTGHQLAIVLLTMLRRAWGS